MPQSFLLNKVINKTKDTLQAEASWNVPKHTRHIYNKARYIYDKADTLTIKPDTIYNKADTFIIRQIHF